MKKEEILLVQPETSEGATIHRMLVIAGVSFSSKNVQPEEAVALRFAGSRDSVIGFKGIERYISGLVAARCFRENKRRML